MSDQRRLSKCETVFYPVSAITPHNCRMLVFGKMPAGHEEMAMAWWEKIDNRWYFAPQGGLLPFEPQTWCWVPEPPTENAE